MPTKTNSPLHIAPALIGMGIKGLVGGFGEVLRDRKEAKDAGEKYSFKEGLGDFGRGLASGVTGMDFTDQIEAEEQPTYKTNIDPITGEEIPLMMTGNMKPLKMLTGIKGNTPHNMSAAQYKSAIKMSEISGASSLMFTEEGLNKLPNDIPGEFGDIVRKEKTEQQQKNK